MLSYPDRKTFEEIRARWENGQSPNDTSSAMVGRKERQPFQHSTDDERHTEGVSKFRRKLSHGLALISNPLSQRRTTPGRHQGLQPPQAVPKSATASDLVQSRKRDVCVSPKLGATLVEHLDGSALTSGGLGNNHCSEDPETTPRPLTRSRTFSFIPRLIRAESQSYTTRVEEHIEPEALTAINGPPSRSTPSKIPIPSPVLSERRHPSPRQYSLYNSSQSVKHDTKAMPSIEQHKWSSSKPTIRSHTTPNLLTAANLPLRPGFMASASKTNKKSDMTPIGQKRILQENTPTNTRAQLKQLRLRDKPSVGASLATPNAISKEISTGLPTLHLLSEQPASIATSSGLKRTSSQFTRPVPMTVPRVEPTAQIEPIFLQSTGKRANTSSFKYCAIGSRYPPTPTPQRSTSRRRTLGTLTSSGSLWRTSRALPVPKTEVRRLPRSNTFHNYSSCRDSAPPVPTIPEQYRTPSLPKLAHCVHVDANDAVVPQSSQTVPDASSCKMMCEESGEVEHNCSRITSPESEHLEKRGSSDCSTLKNYSTTTPVVSPAVTSSTSTQATFMEELANSYLCSSEDQSLSLHEQYECLENADANPLLQVNDYMPPIYWAGRFQARFDQWRTEATISELNPGYITSGPLGEYKLHQEKLAVCYIFAQLRELCKSTQAAKSLWV